MLWSPQPSTYTNQNEAAGVEHMLPMEATTCEVILLLFVLTNFSGTIQALLSSNTTVYVKRIHSEN
jgi:hypothetical protein